MESFVGVAQRHLMNLSLILRADPKADAFRKHEALFPVDHPVELVNDGALNWQHAQLAA